MDNKPDKDRIAIRLDILDKAFRYLSRVGEEHGLKALSTDRMKTELEIVRWRDELIEEARALPPARLATRDGQAIETKAEAPVAAEPPAVEVAPHAEKEKPTTTKRKEKVI